MVIRKGRVKGTSEYGSPESMLDVWEIDFNGEKLLAVKEVDDGFLVRTTFNHSLDDMGRFFSTRDYGTNPTIEWVVPLAVVPEASVE